jgi:hypothetical protein
MGVYDVCHISSVAPHPIQRPALRLPSAVDEPGGPGQRRKSGGGSQADEERPAPCASEPLPGFPGLRDRQPLVSGGDHAYTVLTELLDRVPVRIRTVIETSQLVQ